MRAHFQLALFIAVFFTAPGVSRAQPSSGGQLILDIGTSVGSLDIGDPPPGDRTLAILTDGHPAGSFSFDVNVGWTVVRRFGLFGSFGSEFGAESDDAIVPTTLSASGLTTGFVTKDHETLVSTFAFGGQYWATADLWVRAAVAAADLGRSWTETETGTIVSLTTGSHPGFLFVAGFNLERMVGFAIDARFRYFTSSINGTDVQSIGALVGLPIKYPR